MHTILHVVGVWNMLIKWIEDESEETPNDMKAIGREILTHLK